MTPTRISGNSTPLTGLGFATKTGIFLCPHLAIANERENNKAKNMKQPIKAPVLFFSDI